MRWKDSDTRRRTETRWFTGELICSSRRVEGEAREAVGVASSSPAVRIPLPCDVIHLAEHKSERRWRESRRGIVGGESHWNWLSADTVPWQSSIQSVWQPIFRPNLLTNLYGNILIVLQQSCCPLYHLHLCYSSHGQILTRLVINCFQRWSNATVSLIFRLNQPDSQTSGLIISKFFLTTELTFLSKVVLLW
jgi:hypothetical protein